MSIPGATTAQLPSQHRIDQALVDRMAQTITDALVGCDLRTMKAAVYGGNVAAGAVTPLIAAAVDAARAEGYEQGKAAVREQMEGAGDEQCTHWSTRPGYHPIRCTAPAGHYTEERDWHRVGSESWNDADGEYRA